MGSLAGLHFLSRRKVDRFKKAQGSEFSLFLPFVKTIDSITDQHSTMEGKVKFFNEAKGYGFIREKESGEEYFVHATGLIDEIRDEDDVSFELREGRKGMNAVDVRRVD